MLFRRQFFTLIMIGFIIAVILKIFKMGGWIEHIPVYIVFIPLGILLSLHDNILIRLGYHPSLWYGDDVPPYLSNIILISLVIAIPLGIYLFSHVLRKMLQARIKRERNMLNC